MYFYYNVSVDNSINLPTTILKITNYYLIDQKLYIIGIPLTFTNNNFTSNLLYLIDNEYILQINNENSNENDIKKITSANIASDSINIYNNYISSTNNTNFNLDGTIITENIQKATFISNFTNYIIKLNVNNFFTISNSIKILDNII
jgi:predicted ester cyclase